ncbi:head-tail connector protein [Xinfangfangia sp. CPCC 101601]|uniref:Head-tail connector protein n=1 Tax=Pseudogemmobacter lacusdianii TaxID=3069608 RepID=A0ABU0W103_9RHOB|nr:head-tail connector protein [Xinfangfangia sp. CPCC 101601]MDQ2067700.1 head-tail connector protein [Xinfangfangia sp. CPCC 101601]
MMLTEVTAVPGAALPVGGLIAHLRLGTGFALPEGQEVLLESHLRAAIAAIEARVAKALIQRAFLWELAEWRDPDGVAMPLAPVAEILSLSMVDAGGAEWTVAETGYRLIADRHRPRLAGRGGGLPLVPSEGRVLISFVAGFAADWEGVPADLQQAVLLLAAEFYEHRHDAGAASGLPSAVNALIEPWRQVRVLGGGGRR